MPLTLGYASSITVTDLLHWTNQKRAGANLPPLILNEKLSQAAGWKAENMFAEQYWAHTSPSGKDPWSYITQAGYRYLYAGENLARDFGDSKSVVEAWMNSKSHKDNLLSSRYEEIGFAVVNGKYRDYETTLVVQMFGALPRTISVAPVPLETAEVVLPVQEMAAPAPIPAALPQQAVSRPYDVFAFVRSLALAIGLVLVGVLFIDALIVFHRKTIRLSGHTAAHLLFFLSLLTALLLVQRGVII